MGPDPADSATRVTNELSAGVSVRSTRRRLGGLLTRRERWALSWKGWVALFITGVLGLTVLMRQIHPFLAVTDTVVSRYLVVEGWVHEFAFVASVVEFKRGDYQQILTTGGPIPGTGEYTSDSNTSASVGAERLVALGVPEKLVHKVPSRIMARDRTYSSALALRAWMQAHAPTDVAINIITEDLHARRTRLLFQKAFGDQLKIGIIAVPNPDYDARHWWYYSEGVRDVFSESIAYLYARLIFTR
jgi:uncharacterized SAM-binding protein YcdF (DUF218 family)